MYWALYRSCDFRGCTLKYPVLFLVSCLAPGQNSICDFSGLIIGNNQPLFSSPGSWESVLPTTEPVYGSFLEGAAVNGILRLPCSEAHLHCQSRPLQLKAFLSGTLVEALSKERLYQDLLMGALARVLFYVSVPCKPSSPPSHPAGPWVHREAEEFFVLGSSALKWQPYLCCIHLTLTWCHSRAGENGAHSYMHMYSHSK